MADNVQEEIADIENVNISTSPTESPALEQNMGSAASGANGNLVSVPGIVPDDAKPSRADHNAARQLTGKASKLTLPAQPLTPTQETWRKFRKNKLAVAGGVLLIIFYTVALLAQFLAPYAYDSQDKAASFQPPMQVHWTPTPTVYTMTQSFDQFQDRIYVEDKTQPHRIKFFVHGPSYKFWGLIPSNLHLYGAAGGERVYLFGTDQFGRDYLSRLLYASQISLSVGLLGIAITFSLGMLVGGISGFYGGRTDDIIMRLCEVVMSVPGFYLLLALAATLPPTLSPVAVYLLIILILSFVGWAGMARIIRGMVLSVREREYVEAAHALGVSDLKIVVRHIIPSTFTFAIVAATLSIPAYILGEAALSFLNVGIRDPMPSWGNMLTAAQDLTTLEQRQWLLIPGLAIFLTTLAFNFLGDGLRDALDPKSR